MIFSRGITILINIFSIYIHITHIFILCNIYNIHVVLCLCTAFAGLLEKDMPLPTGTHVLWYLFKLMPI